jgi:hypothetical protein
MRTSHAASLTAACALIIGLSTPLAAQDGGFGARSGVALGGLHGLDGARGRPGMATGPTFAARLNRWLAIQTELLYTTYGAWLTDAVAIQASGTPFSQASFRYLQAPIFARIDVGALLDAPVQALLYAGPHVSAMLTCRLDVPAPMAERVPCGSAPETSPFSGMRTVDLGAAAGASLAVELFNLFQLAADVRYQRGFTQYGPLYGGFRNGMWAFAFRLSGAYSRGAPAGDIEPPLPPMIQGAPLPPNWPVIPKGVRM